MHRLRIARLVTPCMLLLFASACGSSGGDTQTGTVGTTVGTTDIPDPSYPDGVYACTVAAGTRVIDVDAAGGPEAALALADGIAPAVVRFQPHLYTVSRTLSVHARTTLCGDAGQTVLQLAPGGPATLMLGDSGAVDITINGITFDGNRSAQTTGGVGINLPFSHTAHVINVRVQNFRGASTGGAAFVLQGADRPVVEHSFFVDNGSTAGLASDGLYVSGNGARVSDNYARANSDTCFATQNSTDMLFERNLAKNCGNGFGAGSPASLLVFRNNKAQGNLYGFFYCPCNRSPAGHDVTLDSNLFADNTAAGIYLFGVPGDMPGAFTLTANTVRHTAGSSPLPEGTNGVFLRYVRSARLQQNVIETSDNHGILVIGSSNLDITQNTVRNNSQSRACAAYGVLVKDETQTPVLSDAISITDNNIYDDQARPTQGRAIVLSTNGTTTIRGNSSTGNCGS